MSYLSLVRHGQSEWNEKNLFTGWENPGLTEKGLVEAKEAGVEMRVCSAALQLHDMTEDDLIEECDGVIGAAYMVDVGMDSAMVLNY